MNSKCVIPLLSHELLEIQKCELKEKFGVDKVIELPEDLKETWANINPGGSLDKFFIKKLKDFILSSTREGDYIIIQGEWGMTFSIVVFALNSNRIPIYGTTEREVVEKIDKDKVVCERVFQHCQFRKYEII